MKEALITRITGQDSSYLAELLLSKGCKVHGIIRRASTFNTGRIGHIYVDLILKKLNYFCIMAIFLTPNKLTTLSLI